MATLRQASRANMDGWKPADAPAPATGQPSIPHRPAVPPRSAMMLASMPLMASTGDAFQRQFYGGADVPSYRILPAKKGGGA